MADTPVIILQARSSSSRLPGKVSMQIGGKPLAVMSALRAGNTGLPVIVATSDEASDDAFAALLAKHGLTVSRGPLEDALSRFLNALSGYDAEQIVVRLTADNVFPDGAFISDMVRAFIAADCDIMGGSGTQTGLPYGVAAEVFRLKSLRAIDLPELSAADREHVTSCLWQKGRAVPYVAGYALPSAANLRATVDYAEDYALISKVFSEFAVPEDVPMLDLVEKLGVLTERRAAKRQFFSKLYLGGAQFGLHYGVTNTKGMLSEGDVAALIKRAHALGCRGVDTAPAYGMSEARIGQVVAAMPATYFPFQVLSKTPHVFPDNEAAAKAMLSASFISTLRHLKSEKLGGLLFHRADDCFKFDGQLYAHVQLKKRDGRIAKVGVSVQSPQELEACLTLEGLDIIQMPYNMLEHRFDALVPKVLEARSKYGLQIHIRSTFLQGAIAANSPDVWTRIGVVDEEKLYKWIKAACVDAGCDTPKELALRYCLSEEWVDGIVLGMTQMSELNDAEHIFKRGGFAAKKLQHIKNTRPTLPEAVLNPALWQR